MFCKKSTLLRAFSGSPRKGGTSWNQRTPRGSQSEYNNPIVAETFPDKKNWCLWRRLIYLRVFYVGTFSFELVFLSLTFFRDPAVHRELLATLVLVVLRSVHQPFKTLVDENNLFWADTQLKSLVLHTKCVILGCRAVKESAG